MNDLERDLTALFQQKAASVDPVPTAPEGVLRRGRRRQFGTVAGAFVCAVTVVIVGLLVVGSITPPPAQVPVGRVAAWTTGGQLVTTVEGGATSATFDALGTTWRVRDDMAGATLEQVSGTPSAVYSLLNDSGIEVNEPEGTIFLEQTAPDVDRVFIAIDGDGLAEGRWMQTFRDSGGRPGRLWVVPVPGTGTGTRHVGNQIPTLVSWPTHRIPQHGDVVMAGSDGVVSWGLRWDETCPFVDVILPPADAGAGDGTCIKGWSQGPPTIVFAGGPKHVMVAVTGPAGMTAALRGPNGSLVLPCYEPHSSGSWSGTSICVVPLTVGSVYTLDLRDASGRMLGRMLKLTPTPGGLTVG